MSIKIESGVSGYQLILADGSVMWRDDKNKGMVTVERLHEYWRNPDGDNIEGAYFTCPERSQKLVDYFKKYISPQDSIMELGCNVGRNLHYLYESGYRNLTGIDINKKSLELGAEHYPELKQTNLVCGEIGQELAKLESNSVDVIFTMAVLEHIHPKEQNVFTNIARVAKKFVITCEDEKAIFWRAFSYDYESLFEYLALKQVETSSLLCKNDIDDTGDCTLTYRIFKK